MSFFAGAGGSGAAGTAGGAGVTSGLGSTTAGTAGTTAGTTAAGAGTGATAGTVAGVNAGAGASALTPQAANASYLNSSGGAAGAAAKAAQGASMLDKGIHAAGNIAKGVGEGAANNLLLKRFGFELNDGEFSAPGWDFSKGAQMPIQGGSSPQQQTQAAPQNAGMGAPGRFITNVMSLVGRTPQASAAPPIPKAPQMANQSQLWQSMYGDQPWG